MGLIDRYVLRLFGKVLLVCFGSLAGLYVVVETFNNLEEFIELGKAGGGMHAVLLDYFLPRLFSLFDRTSSLLTLIAAIFTLTWLQRTNELTAIMAGGIPRLRVVRCIIWAAIGISVVAMVNREGVIPHFGKALVRNAQSWDGRSAAIHPRYDYQTGVFINGSQLVPNERMIETPVFQLPRKLAVYGAQLEAARARYQGATESHPAGYLLEKVVLPKRSDTLESVVDAGSGTRLSLPVDTPWLESGQAFLPSEVDVGQLEFGIALQQYASTGDLIAEMRNPSLDYGATMRRITHVRLLQPVMDLSLFLIGLPLVVSRGEKNIFVAAGSCLGVLIFYFMLIFGCAYLGESGMLRPYQAAWCPLFVLIPWAAWAFPRINA